ncbi:MAG: tetratricopeptide repeat protein [Coriobacteriia bacterium]
MGTPRPRVKRVGDRSTLLAWSLVGVIVLLAVAVGVLLNANSLFGGQPRSDLERDYDLLVDGLRENPDDPAVLMTLAEAEYDLGKTTDAFAHGVRAVEVAGESDGFRLRLSQLYIMDGRFDQAQQLLEAELATESADTDSESYFLLGQVQRELGDLDAAVRSLAEAVRLTPVSADMRLVYAEALEEAEQIDEAIEQYQAALRFLPDSERAVAGLNRLGVEAEASTTATMPGGIPGQDQ